MRPVEPRHRNPVARLHHQVRGLAVERRIRLLIKLVGRRRGLRVVAMINVLLDRQAPRHFGQPAEMIAMVVRDDHVIDLRDSRVLRRRRNAPGIAHRRRCRVPGINQHRLARRRDKQHGVPALHVHHINIQRASLPRRVRRTLPRRKHRGERQQYQRRQQSKYSVAHRRTSSQCLVNRKPGMCRELLRRLNSFPAVLVKR